jgi:AcrR family transcriptional regulator
MARMSATKLPPREKLLEVAADLFYREGFRAVAWTPSSRAPAWRR